MEQTPFSKKNFEAGNFRLGIEQFANGRNTTGVATSYVSNVKVCTIHFETIEIEQAGDIFHITLKTGDTTVAHFTNLFRA